MSRPRLLIALLVLATVLADLVVRSIVLGDSWLVHRPPEGGSVYLVLWSLVLAQASLAAIWTATAGKWMPWTAIALFGTIVFGQRLIGFPATLYAVLLLLQAAVVLAAAGLARLAAVRIVHFAGDVSAWESTPTAPRLQFSLRTLFSWITSLAIVLSLLNYTIEFPEVVPELREIWRPLAALSVGDAAMALAALWAVLGVQRATLRITAMCLAVLGTIALWHAVEQLGPPRAILTVCAFQALWLLLALSVVRTAGYRLVRVCRPASLVP